jgi:hypothetical protein
MRVRRGLCALLLLLSACGSDGGGSDTGAFERMVAASRSGAWRAEGDDVVEVWVCKVPSDTTVAVYGGLPLRADFTPQQLVDAITPRVTEYFRTISHGRYQPSFVGGGTVTMRPADEPADCAAAALDQAAPSSRSVLLVADAEHAADQPGGFGSAGQPTNDRSAKDNRRWAYVGANDFSADWSDDPPMDLIEHELGHTIGWVHSGTDINPPLRYTSALDVMSDSAAPRDVDANRRDGPDTIAVQRVAAGWMDTDAVVVATGSLTVQLAPSTADAGKRLVVVPLDDRSFLTIELLTAEGFDDHLPVAGLAVHRVTIGGDDLPATIDPLNNGPRHTALLEQGGALTTDGWVIAAGGAGTDAGSVVLRRATA